ncbi:hypothetical protein [Streptomyces sp. WG7]|uniref:hypothetical protein n=1 Tax=Streptomyces sp. WG7 TaxID=3417650 RepID=UPI003CEB7C1F
MARRVQQATPHNTPRAPRYRAELFHIWCREHGRVASDPGTVPDHMAWLADRGHLPETLETYAGSLAHVLAVIGHLLDDEDRSYVTVIVNHRATEVAADPDGIEDALQG